MEVRLAIYMGIRLAACKLVTEPTNASSTKDPFGGAYQGNQGGAGASGESETDMHLRAAANYIQSGHFAEALNVLDGIKERRALWYFYSASANSGVGNNVTALEHAQKAVELEPNNLQYQMLLQRLQGGGGWYQQRQGMYGYPVATGDACMKACIATALCNLCCGGGCCYVPVSPGGGFM